MATNAQKLARREYAKKAALVRTRGRPATSAARGDADWVQITRTANGVFLVEGDLTEYRSHAQGIPRLVTDHAIVFYRAARADKSAVIRAGIPSGFLASLSARLGYTVDKLFSMLHIPRTTGIRRMQNAEMLTTEESEKAVGLATLIGQVESIVQESGRPEGFDAGKWLAEFVEQPHKALGGHKPADLLGDAEGRAAVSQLIGQMQSGAYA